MQRTDKMFPDTLPTGSPMPLQLRYPTAYETLVNHLEQLGLQVFDVKAEVLESGSTVQVRVSYGDFLSTSDHLNTRRDSLESLSDEVKSFLSKCADKCHETLKARYNRDMGIESHRLARTNRTTW